MSKSVIYSNPSNYFEAVMQLRPFDDEVYLFIENQVNKREDLFITKIVKLKHGLDIYLSSQRDARRIGYLLKKKFPKGELKITRKLHTQDRQTSKKLYRATVLFRMKREEED